MTAPREDVAAELERILASQALAGSDQLRRLLKLVVTRTLDGHADLLKEYNLGLDVFQRPPDYDPKLDPIVRVQARRLRAKLGEYYAGEGAHHTLVVQIPKGAYVPVFEQRGAGPGEAGARQSASGLPWPRCSRWPPFWPEHAFSQASQRFTVTSAAALPCFRWKRSRRRPTAVTWPTKLPKLSRPSSRRIRTCALPPHHRQPVSRDPVATTRNSASASGALGGRGRCRHRRRSHVSQAAPRRLDNRPQSLGRRLPLHFKSTRACQLRRRRPGHCRDPCPASQPAHPITALY